MGRSSPSLMFLGTVCVLWVGARVAIETWEAIGLTPGTVPNRAASAAAAGAGVAVARIAPLRLKVADGQVGRNPVSLVKRSVGHVRNAVLFSGHRIETTMGMPPIQHVDGELEMSASASATSLPPPSDLPGLPARNSVDRWTLSGWVYFRPTSAPTTLGQGRFGGSQAGVRAARRIDNEGQAVAYARIVSSGEPGDGAEGAVGVSMQLLRTMPMRLSVERRQQMVGRGGRSAFAAFVAGGVSDRALPLEFGLDGYAAAGVVGAQRRDLFAEGSVTVRRRIVTVGRVEVDAGMGAWGAAQRELERVDVGPSLSARWRVGEVQQRLSVDWRQRVVGDAAPQSGVTVTLAADF